MEIKASYCRFNMPYKYCQIISLVIYHIITVSVCNPLYQFDKETNNRVIGSTKLSAYILILKTDIQDG